MRLFLLKSHKLQGKLEFQGLPISIENKAGSSRHWYDPHADEHGTTKMKYPYGYVRGTLGVDGDEVDVFVGPDESSTKVFVVTQMKAPDFEDVDEQKVMLGFSSASSAKEAYLEHYTDSKFFGSMKELSVEQFKEKLKTHKGKLIKHLFLSLTSANIQQADLSKKDKDMADTNIQKSCEHSKDATCEKCNGTHSTSDVLKGLTSRMLSVTKRHIERSAAVAEKQVVPDSDFQTQEVTLFGPQVAQAMHKDRPWEPPHVPKVSISTPAQAGSPMSPDFMSSCDGCGYTHKSLSTCPRCEYISSTNREATPIWRR